MSLPKTYRLYRFDGSSMTVSSDTIDAANDSDAIAKVEAMGFGSKCEIWDARRLVAQIEGERRQA
jgi:hypothetical protein